MEQGLLLNLILFSVVLYLASPVLGYWSFKLSKEFEKKAKKRRRNPYFETHQAPIFNETEKFSPTFYRKRKEPKYDRNGAVTVKEFAKQVEIDQSTVYKKIRKGSLIDSVFHDHDLGRMMIDPVLGKEELNRVLH